MLDLLASFLFMAWGDSDCCDWFNSESVMQAPPAFCFQAVQIGGFPAADGDLITTHTLTLALSLSHPCVSKNEALKY